MEASIERNIEKARKNGENIDLVFAEWKVADSEIDAFIDEYWRILNDGGSNSNNYNRIMSPGRKLYEKMLNELFK